MRRLALLLLAVFGLTVAAVAAHAQDKYPARFIKIIVPYGPGGATDIVARVLAEQLRQILGQTFIVENKPGAYGIIALQELARATPDGYTMMIGNVSTNAITPVLYRKKMSFNYERDIVPVARLVDIPAFFAATTRNFAPKTVAEFVDYVKNNPGKVNYGVVGVGSYPHYDMALFAKRAGNLDMVAIPNKEGASGVITDMLSGSSHTAFLNVASTAGVIKAGNLRAIALVNHARLPEYPDVPTMQEVGFPDVGTLAWQALFAPAGTPKEVLETVRGAIVQAMRAQTVIDTFRQQNFNVVPTDSLDEAKTWLGGEIDKWRKTTQEVKIEIAE
jgi:tripartite-type tricarboxylate transporter receptor subunit TctC